MGRLIEPFVTYNDVNGAPLSGGKLQFNIVGSPSVAKGTFSDVGLTVANTNPIVLDSAGRVTVDVFGSGDYRMIVKSSTDATIKTFENLTPPVDLTAEVTGDLPVADGGTGASTAADARANLGVDVAGTDNSTDVTLAGVLDYLTIIGQIITLAAIDLTTDVTGDLPVADGGTGASDAATARTNLGITQWTKHATVHTGVSSGSDLDWNNIPAGITALRIVYENNSFSGNTDLGARLGDASSFEVTGYSGRVRNSSAGTSWSTDADLTQGGVGANIMNGSIDVVNITGNTWSIVSSATTEGGEFHIAAGAKTLTGVLTRFKLRAVDGASTFDGSGNYALYYQ